MDTRDRGSHLRERQRRRVDVVASDPRRVADVVLDGLAIDPSAGEPGDEPDPSPRMRSTARRTHSRDGTAAAWVSARSTTASSCAHVAATTSVSTTVGMRGIAGSASDGRQSGCAHPHRQQDPIAHADVRRDETPIPRSTRCVSCSATIDRLSASVVTSSTRMRCCIQATNGPSAACARVTVRGRWVRLRSRR